MTILLEETTYGKGARINMDNREYFVGNTDINDKEFKIFDSLGIKYRFGEVAKDIHGKVIKNNTYKPLYIIGELSLKKYDDFRMKELRKIRMG